MSTPQETQHPRAAILDAAMQLFGKRGYTGTTMRDIATAVSMLPGSLYAHIDGKETLLVELVEYGIEQFLTVEKIIADQPESPLLRMRAAIKAHIAVLAENPERALVVFHQWRFLSEANLPRAVEKRSRYQQIFTRIVTDGIKCGDFSDKLDSRIAVFTILGALNWTAEWYSPTGSLNVDEIGEKLADTLLGGLINGGQSALVAAAKPAVKKAVAKKQGAES